MGELVQEADRASVAQFMGANASTSLERPQPSLEKQMLTALRELVQTQFKLSNPRSGSDGWLTEEALWLISKTTADKIRAWLLQQGVTSIPDSNIRLFDEMQAYGLIIPTPEGKAVWSCDITADSGWAPGCPLTLLRLSPSRFWTSSEKRPALFARKVEPAANSAENTISVDTRQPVPSLASSEITLTDFAFSLFAPQEETIQADNPPLTEASHESIQPVIKPKKHPNNII